MLSNFVLTSSPRPPINVGAFSNTYIFGLMILRAYLAKNNILLFRQRLVSAFPDDNIDRPEHTGTATTKSKSQGISYTHSPFSCCIFTSLMSTSSNISCEKCQ